ncbi:hypothetical protein ACIP98_35490 [Streptomyces sp. NPDC088354]|uniref:hypothetical protein n=1 Tax=Streptomyces sp. NPDC088354 TaxID=3365856 RepID=UPI003819426E
MGSWQDFVVGVEAGFDTTWIWEYYSDLGCRDWLDAALLLLTPALRALCQTVIERWDARYLAATGPIKPQSPQSSRSSTQGMWWHDRFPLLMDHDEEIRLPPSWSPERRRLVLPDEAGRQNRTSRERQGGTSSRCHVLAARLPFESGSLPNSLGSA